MSNYKAYRIFLDALYADCIPIDVEIYAGKYRRSYLCEAAYQHNNKVERDRVTMKKKALPMEEHTENESVVEICDDDMNTVVGGVVNDSAEGDSSDYQISDRMKVQSCAPDQANYNAQNASGETMDKFLPGTIEYA